MPIAGAMTYCWCWRVTNFLREWNDERSLVVSYENDERVDSYRFVKSSGQNTWSLFESLANYLSRRSRGSFLRRNLFALSFSVVNCAGRGSPRGIYTRRFPSWFSQESTGRCSIVQVRTRTFAAFLELSDAAWQRRPPCVRVGDLAAFARVSEASRAGSIVDARCNSALSCFWNSIKPRRLFFLKWPARTVLNSCKSQS